MKQVEKQADILLEVSWEVCNKVGGIYTVISSKASQCSRIYGDNYFLIGPYFLEKAKGEFEESSPPEYLKGIFESLRSQGLSLHFGKWLLESEPKTILIDFQKLWPKVNDIKGELWKNYQIDSLNAPRDFDEPIVWATAVGMFIDEFVRLFPSKKIVAQFHEWLSGGALLYLKSRQTRIGTVFTTHATFLGRVLTGANFDLYSNIDSIRPDEEAKRRGICAKHLTEKASALNADTLTTVSKITALEVEKFLGRKPDILLPNGIDIGNFPTFEEISIQHRLQRDRIRAFLLYYFMPYYSFDPAKSLFYFITGRYEFHNKGIDIFIEALGKFNRLQSKEKKSKTIVAFFWVPTAVRGIRPEVIENRELYSDLRQYLEEARESLNSALLYSLISRGGFTEKNLFRKEVLREIHKKILRFKRKGLPPLSTHEIIDDNDPILKAFKENGLLNLPSDKVKVIFYPVYLTGTDGILNLNYFECILGSHLGVFPSYYEPWGYTPLETGASGVAAVTTDLAGFGRFIGEEKTESPGIFILKRFQRNREEIVKSLVNILYRYAHFSHQERVENKIQARELAERADWQVLIKNYVNAHNKALEVLAQRT